MHTVPKLKDPSLLITQAYVNGEFVDAASSQTFDVHDPGTGNSIVQCISGMIERDPQRRWGCAQVKEWIESLLTKCKTSTAKNGDAEEPRTSTIGDLMKKVKSLDDAEESS